MATDKSEPRRSICSRPATKRSKLGIFGPFLFPNVFPINNVGIVTARDRLTIRWSAEEIVGYTVRAFSQMDPELAKQGYELGKDVQKLGT